MDITSPTVLKLKGLLFVVLGTLAAVILLLPVFSWTNLALLALCVWSFCRAYYFCFYVMHHYVDPAFRYTGLFDLLKHLVKRRPANQ